MPSGVVREASTPSPEAAAEAASLVAGIADVELRERVEKAASLGLSRASDNRPI
jgi:hypothetical protein